jgi:hypothetical protein
MADHPIEQFLCRTPKPKQKRPNHIAMPVVSAMPYAQPISRPEEKCEAQDLTVLTLPPRPPIPPRRHTLAEICRYADEQCAYIEWMTRELEAEEAARRHSTPTTPAGAITNPFSGPADMWWRPMSANDMYGKSALRRQQEEEEKARMQHPYLAANSLPEFFETNRIRENGNRNDAEVESTDEEVDTVPSDSQALEKYASESRMIIDEAEDDVSTYLRGLDGHDARSRRTRVPTSTQSSQRSQNLDLSRLEQDSIFMMIPKALFCFLLLPLILTIGWCSSSFSEDEER